MQIYYKIEDGSLVTNTDYAVTGRTVQASDRRNTFTALLPKQDDITQNVSVQANFTRNDGETPSPKTMIYVEDVTETNPVSAESDDFVKFEFDLTPYDLAVSGTLQVSIKITYDDGTDQSSSVEDFTIENTISNSDEPIDSTTEEELLTAISAKANVTDTGRAEDLDTTDKSNIVAGVNEIKDIADTASTDASTAVSTANNANGTALLAQDVAELASAVSQSADAKADTAISTANDAETTANNAKAVIDEKIDLLERAEDIVDTGEPLLDELKEKKNIKVVDNIAERDALTTLYEGRRVHVVDATDDETVESGWAEYLCKEDGESFTWIKTSEKDSIDVVLDADNVTVSSTPENYNVSSGMTNETVMYDDTTLNLVTDDVSYDTDKVKQYYGSGGGNEYMLSIILEDTTIEGDDMTAGDTILTVQGDTNDMFSTSIDYTGQPESITVDEYTFTGFTYSSGDNVEEHLKGIDSALANVGASATVTFDYQGADGGDTTESKEVTLGQAFGELPTPTKTGEDFLGWYVGDTQITSESIMNGTFDFDGELELKAKWGTEYSSENLEYESISGGYRVIESPNATQAMLEIPDTYNGQPVIEIADDAFKDVTTLEKVKIGNNVESIGSDAFYGCTNLTDVIIGDSVTTIGNYAFYSAGLTTLTIPNSVTSIGSFAFRSCTSLTSITIGNSVTSIDSQAFRDCSSLENITIPDSVTSIGGLAFYECTSLLSVTVERSEIVDGSITSLDGNAFNDTSTSLSIEVPADSLDAYKTASNWDDYADHITAPTAIVFDSNGGTEVPMDTTSSGQPITAPEEPEKHGYTFAGWYEEDTFDTLYTFDTMPSSPITLYAKWIESDDIITDNDLEDTTPTAGKVVQYGTDGVVKVADGVADDDAVNKGQLDNTLDNKASLLDAFNEDNILTISSTGGLKDSNKQFEYNLTSSYSKVPTSGAVMNYISSAIANATIFVKQADKTYLIIEATSGNNTLPLALPESGSINPTINWGDGSQTTPTINHDDSDGDQIHDYSSAGTYLITISETINGFYYNGEDYGQQIKEAHIGSNCPIGDNCFSGCSNLEKVDFIVRYNEGMVYGGIKGWTFTSIGDYAFAGCVNLNNISIPRTVETIGEAAFAGCRSQTNFNIYNVTSIGKEAFRDCVALTTINLNPQTSIGFTIKEETFLRCYSLSSIVLKGTLNKIESSAFKHCFSLSTIQYFGSETWQTSDSESDYYIGDNAFDSVSAMVLQGGGNFSTKAVEAGLTLMSPEIS